MPRRSSGQLLRRTRPSCSSRATSRERALAHVDVLDELLEAAAAAVALRQALQCLELGDRQPVVALEVALERRVDPRVVREQLAPPVDEVGALGRRAVGRHVDPGSAVMAAPV